MKEKKTLIWPKIGNEKIVDFLEKSIINNNLAQTYLFVGSNDLGKYTLALALAKNLLSLGEYNFSDDSFLSSQADVHVIRREKGKKNISIAQIREFINILNLSSFNGSYKIGIIKEADYLSENAKYALLKLLEEPKEKVIIILLLNNIDSLPKTIVSRSQVLYFQTVSKDLIYHYLLDNYKMDRTKAKNISSLSFGKPLRAMQFAENIELYNNYIEEIKKVFLWTFSDPIEKEQMLGGLSINSIEKLQNLLNIIEGLLRDVLLLNLNQPESLQYSILLSELKNIKMENREIVDKLQLISKIREYLKNNVSYKVCLDKLILNF